MAQQSVSTSIGVIEAFNNQCCELIIRGYYRVRDSKKVTIKFDEEDISDFLAEQMENYCREECLPYHIDTDSRDRSATVDGVNIKGKKRKRFDIKFSCFSNPGVENAFGVEAKIVTETKSSILITAYISEKGMKKFIDSIYSKAGCMIGYVRQGSTKNILKKINDRIAKGDILPKNEQLKNAHFFSGFDYHYESNHFGYKCNPLKHLFLGFTDEDA